MPFDARHWNLIASPLALAVLACAQPIPVDEDETSGTETGEMPGDGDGDGDGDGGDGDGDGDGDSTTGDDDECNNDADCDGDDICYIDMCVPPLGDCYSDSDCPGGICEGYHCQQVDALPTCDSPGGLIELPIPEQLDGVLPLALEMGDVDGDGDDDILVASSSGLTAVIADLAVFSALGPWDVEGMTPFALDDDGDLDLAVWRQGSLELYLGDGAGSFVLLETIDGVHDSVEELAHLDADGDGDDDLLADGWARGVGAGIVVWFNDAGVLTPVPTIPAGRHDLAIGDFGGDGRDEFISSANEVSLEIFLYEPPWQSQVLNSDLLFWRCEGIEAVWQPGAAHLALLGVEDRYDTQLLHSWSGAALTEYHGWLGLPADTPLLEAGDFDGDGSSSGFAYGGDTNSILIHLGASVEDHCYESIPLKTERAAVGDVDGDGDHEIAMVVDVTLRLYGDP